MKRVLFLLSLSAAAAAFATVRAGRPRRSRLQTGLLAGSCADHRRKLRWSGYTAADVG